MISKLIIPSRYSNSVAYNDDMDYDYLALLGEGYEDGVYNNPGVLPRMDKLYQESLLDPDGSCTSIFDEIWQVYRVMSIPIELCRIPIGLRDMSDLNRSPTEFRT
jgi:hypothetical protein